MSSNPRVSRVDFIPNNMDLHTVGIAFFAHPFFIKALRDGDIIRPALLVFLWENDLPTGLFLLKN
jgi:hypothetical protein